MSFFDTFFDGDKHLGVYKVWARDDGTYRAFKLNGGISVIESDWD